MLGPGPDAAPREPSACAPAALASHDEDGAGEAVALPPHTRGDETARFDSGRLLLFDLGSEAPEWVEAYSEAAESVVVVSSELRTLAWATPFKRLTELSADNNRIASLKGCHDLPHLTTLSLNMNIVTDLNTLLVHCAMHFPRLAHLSLLGNPCCPSEITGQTEKCYAAYVGRVRAALPRLRFLDARELDMTTSSGDNHINAVINPLREAMEKLKSRQFAQSMKSIGQMLINAAIVGKELGTDVSFRAGSLAAETAREFITGAKQALHNAAPGAAAAALSESDQLSILQKQLLPKLLTHDGEAVVAELVALYDAGEIDSDEYRRLLRLNGEMQQETAEINRSNTIRALEEFESYVFPEVASQKRELSVSEDGFSKDMRDSGLKHVTFGKVVTRLTHAQLPPELDLNDEAMLAVASAAAEAEDSARAAALGMPPPHAMAAPDLRCAGGDVTPLRDAACVLDDDGCRDGDGAGEVAPASQTRESAGAACGVDCAAAAVASADGCEGGGGADAVMDGYVMGFLAAAAFGGVAPGPADEGAGAPAICEAERHAATDAGGGAGAAETAAASAGAGADASAAASAGPSSPPVHYFVRECDLGVIV